MSPRSPVGLSCSLVSLLSSPRGPLHLGHPPASVPPPAVHLPAPEASLLPRIPGQTRGRDTRRTGLPAVWPPRRPRPNVPTRQPGSQDARTESPATPGACRPLQPVPRPPPVRGRRRGPAHSRVAGHGAGRGAVTEGPRGCKRRGRRSSPDPAEQRHCPTWSGARWSRGRVREGRGGPGRRRSPVGQQSRPGTPLGQDRAVPAGPRLGLSLRPRVAAPPAKRRSLRVHQPVLSQFLLGSLKPFGKLRRF